MVLQKIALGNFTGIHGISGTSVLWDIFLYFAKAGALVFGSGLAIVPFLHSGVVTEHSWLTERQFLDAVAVAMVTAGPVVITVALRICTSPNMLLCLI